MLIHYFASLEIAMEEMDHATRFITTRCLVPPDGCVGGKSRADLRARFDDLFFVRDFCVLPVSSLFHGLDLFQPIPNAQIPVN